MDIPSLSQIRKELVNSRSWDVPINHKQKNIEVVNSKSWDVHPNFKQKEVALVNS